MDAVLTSCDSIVPGILGVSELPAGSQVADGVVAYPWQVDTKYYTADVRLCTSEVRTIGGEQFADTVQAVIIHFDTRQVRYIRSMGKPVKLSPK